MGECIDEEDRSVVIDGKIIGCVARVVVVVLVIMGVCGRVLGGWGWLGVTRMGAARGFALASRWGDRAEFFAGNQ